MNPRSAGVPPALSKEASETPALRDRYAGVVLAGGRSTRFGGEKAAALLRGKPLMLWCARALGGVCDLVAINARSGSECETLALSAGYPLVVDDPAHPAGPLAGISAGLAWARARGFDALVTLPCDTPLVSVEELGQLVKRLKQGGPEAGPSAAYAVADGRAQGLCAAWRVEIADELDARLARGEHPAVHRWLDQLGAVPVAFEDGAPFRNVNTREDLARVAELTGVVL